MILLVIASLILYQVLGDPIAGGQPIEISDHPWIVSIQKFSRHVCGGSIISEKIILTAAHCITNSPLNSYAVRAGSPRTDSGGSWHGVVAIKCHENFTTIFGMIENDLALMKVSPPLAFGNGVAMIRLPEKWDVFATGTNVSVAGWGSMTRKGTQVLEVRRTHLHIVDTGKCSRSYGDETATLIGFNKQICASGDGSDSCKGDSGGPLVAGDILVGVVSWGSCANPWSPAGVYTDVARYRDWIDENAAFMKFSKYPSETYTIFGFS